MRPRGPVGRASAQGCLSIRGNLLVQEARRSGEIAARITRPRVCEPFRRARLRRRVEREERREETAGFVRVRGLPGETDSALQEPAPVLVGERAGQESVEGGESRSGSGFFLRGDGGAARFRPTGGAAPAA